MEIVDNNCPCPNNCNINEKYLSKFAPIGITGATGATGATGSTETLRAGNVFTVEPEEDAKVYDRYLGDVHYLDFEIPRGVTGEQGETKDTNVLGANIISYNDDPTTFPVNGIEIKTGERLPLLRLEIDSGGILTLDSNDNTFQFNKTGIYYVSFITNAYVKKSGAEFNPTTDFVSIAFREVDSDKTLAGANTWAYNECASNIFGQGIFVVNDIATAYELINTQKKVFLLMVATSKAQYLIHTSVFQWLIFVSLNYNRF